MFCPSSFWPYLECLGATTPLIAANYLVGGPAGQMQINNINGVQFGWRKAIDAGASDLSFKSVIRVCLLVLKGV